MTEHAQAQPVLPLRVAGDACAVPALAVLEVLGARRVVAIPGAPPHVPGVVAWRGRAVAVLDLGVLLGRPRLALDAPPGRIAVLSLAGGVLALPSDAVEAVVIAEARAVGPSRVTQHRFAASEVDMGDRVLPLLDLGLLAQAVLGRAG